MRAGSKPLGGMSSTGNRTEEGTWSVSSSSGLGAGLAMAATLVDARATVNAWERNASALRRVLTLRRDQEHLLAEEAVEDWHSQVQLDQHRPARKRAFRRVRQEARPD